MPARIKIFLPFIILIMLLSLLWRALFYTNPGTLPSALIGESVPAFSLPRLNNPQLLFDNHRLHGRVVLLNIWATWCYACQLEHEMLMKISREHHIPIYSINYKDNIQDAKAWLATKGNPYVMTGVDISGNTAIDLGIYGTPETFVINPQGRIIYRHAGLIDQTVWETVLLPLIQRYTKMNNNSI